MTEQSNAPLQAVPQARFYTISESGQLSTMPTLSEALAIRERGGYFWLDYSNPDSATLNPLMEALNLHPLSIEDCLHSDQLPKLDLFPHYSFLIITAFEDSEDGLKNHELDLFLGKDFVISVWNGLSDRRQTWEEIQRGVERESAKVAQGPSFLLHLIIDQVVDQKFLYINRIEENLEENEDRVLDESGQFNPASLMGSRRDLLLMRRALFHEREVLSKLIRQDSAFIAERSLIYYRDVYDHLSKYYELTENARDQLTSLMEINLSLTSNRMASIGNRTNAIMRRLTLISTIFLPLTLISGIGGMSEFTVMIGKRNIHLSYLVLLVVMALIGLVNYLLLRHMERNLPDDGQDG